MSFFLATALFLGQAASGPNPYVKTLTEPNGIFTLQTASHQLKAPGKPNVWLVGVAHVGERSYYSEIQKLLDAQGEVLFEGVKPKAGEIERKSANSGKGPKSIYVLLSDALKLDFQLADINYKHPNWIDSDLSMDDLEKLSNATPGKAKGFDMLEQLLDENSPMVAQFSSFVHSATPGTLEALKLFFIQNLSTLDPGSALFGDKATKDIVLTARNKSVEDYLDKAITSTAPPKSVAVFYGALHQQSIEDDLAKKYGYKVSEERWFTAASADKTKIDATGQALMQMLSGAMNNVDTPGKK